MRERKPVVGQRFGRWLATAEELDSTKPHTVLCKCDCGTIRSVLAQNLRNGNSRSCGCLRREVNSQTMRKYWSTPRNHYGEPK